MCDSGVLPTWAPGAGSTLPSWTDPLGEPSRAEPGREGGREELAVTPVPGETLGGGGQAAGGGVTAERAPVMEPETRSVCAPSDIVNALW